LIHWVSVQHQLKGIFDFREKRLEEIFSKSINDGVKI